MNTKGWRSPAPAQVIAKALAQAGAELSVPKSRAIVALKKVAAHIGLKAADLHLLDTLFAFSNKKDWEAGQSPIVWASNRILCQQTGLSLSALQRHMRRLETANLIYMHDSPNGKRWGKRDDDGYIVEAFGINLAPLAVREPEFVELFARISHDRQECLSLRNRVIIARRGIRAKIDRAVAHNVRGPWGALQAELNALIKNRPAPAAGTELLQQMVAAFTALAKRVEQFFINAFDQPVGFEAAETGAGAQIVADPAAATTAGLTEMTSKMTPMGAKNDTHIYSTNKLNPVKCKDVEKKKKEAAAPNANQKALEVDMDIQWSTRKRQSGAGVDLRMVMQACPAFTQTAHQLFGFVADWNGLHRAAEQICVTAGISKPAWNVAQTVLGHEGAAVAVALVFDKFSAGEVASPGGYLRGMIEKAKTGRLYLERSFHGRLAAQCKPKSGSTGADQRGSQGLTGPDGGIAAT